MTRGLRPLSQLLSERRAWRNGLTAPLYIPRELHDVRVLLAAGRLMEGMDKLVRLAELGSGAAAAILNFLHLRGLTSAAIDPALTSARCLDAAMRGDSYAQYVVACRFHQEGNHPLARSWLHRSAQQMFLPALCDIGRHFGSCVGGLPVRPEITKSFLWAAFRRGHLLSFMAFVHYGRTGVFGCWFRAVATILSPVVTLVLWVPYYLSPFELTFFAYDPDDVDPPFLNLLR